MRTFRCPLPESPSVVFFPTDADMFFYFLRIFPDCIRNFRLQRRYLIAYLFSAEVQSACGYARNIPRIRNIRTFPFEKRSSYVFASGFASILRDKCNNVICAVFISLTSENKPVSTLLPRMKKKNPPFFCVRKPRSFAEFIFAAGLTIGKHNHDKTGCSANIPMPTRAEPCRGIAPSMPKMRELNAVRHDARLFCRSGR